MTLIRAGGAARAAAACLASCAALLGGCAALGLAPDAPPEPAALPGAAEPAGAPPLVVDIQAPDALRRLLERHLDVVRLGELARGERIDPVERERLAVAAPAQVRSLLETEGYFDPVVRSELDGDRLRIEVEPGPRTTIGRVTVEVQGPLADAADAGNDRARALIDEVQRSWALEPGEAFRDPAWRSAKSSALALLRTQGYAAAVWSGTGAEIDTAARRARLFVVADSGPLFLSGPLDIRGLQYHDAETVRNLADFEPGTPLTESLVLDFQERLRRAGLFDTAAVSFDPDPATAEAAPVLVVLRESARQVWTVGVGVSANTGPRVSAEYLHRRPFGLAAIARNKVEWGRLRQAWDGEVSTHPLAGQMRWLVGGEVERLETDDDIVTALSLRLGRARDTPRADRFSFVEVERSTRRVLATGATGPRPKEDALAVSLNHHRIWRWLDDLLLPTDGIALSLQGNIGQSTSSTAPTGWFSRIYGRATVFRPIGSWFGQARVELGQVFRPDDVRVPDSQQFRAGGDGSVRGYAYRTLGPVVDGAVTSADTLFTASLELARPVVASLPDLWGAVFVDVGDAAPTWRELEPVVGVGVGVRYRSPVGPLKLDLAWAHEQQRLRLHFSVGIAF